MASSLLQPATLQYAQEEYEYIQDYPNQEHHTPSAGLCYSMQTIYSCCPGLMKANSSLIKAN